MAVKNIAFPIRLRQNDNQFSHAYGKYYAEKVPADTLSLAGLIARVGFDQSVYSTDIVQGVISKLTTVMVEVLKQGVSVKWPGLGTFEPSIDASQKGISRADLMAGKFNAQLNIAGVRINFIPENSKGEKLTSRALKDQVTFNTVGVLTVYKQEIDGKTVRRFNTTPLDQWIANGGKPVWNDEEADPVNP